MSLLERTLRSKGVIITALILPGLWPAWPVLQQDATVLADLPKYLLHHYGLVACLTLVAVLTFTPLRVVFPKSTLALALNRHRRLVGVTAFFYALLHVAFHFNYEAGFDSFGRNIVKPFILSGVVAFVILLLLAATSPAAAVRALGGRRWKALHRLVYVAAALVAYHQAAASKVFPPQVLWIFVPLILLEAMRVWRMRARSSVGLAK